ncbi:hypothetical protein KGY73_02565 [bacterium]|nr:hypothetical protein [bacterium]
MCQSHENKESQLQDLLPSRINGWKAQGEGEFYGPESIFDYIDGAGEVYRAYNFKKLLARKYSQKGQPHIHADVFDMGESRNAFGVFTHDLEGKKMGLGQGSTYKGGLLSFWKGRFFVSLYAEEMTEKATKTLKDLGSIVDSRILHPGKKPSIVLRFPQQNLIDQKIHYFYNHLILNYHFFLADKNILILDENTDAALGKYRQDGQKYILLIVHYPSVQKTSRAHQNFLDSYMFESKEKALIQTGEGKWTAIQKMKDSWLVLIFEAPSSSVVEQTMKAVKNKLP